MKYSMFYMLYTVDQVVYDNENKLVNIYIAIQDFGLPLEHLAQRSIQSPSIRFYWVKLIRVQPSKLQFILCKTRKIKD